MNILRFRFMLLTLKFFSEIEALFGFFQVTFARAFQVTKAAFLNAAKLT